MYNARETLLPKPNRSPAQPCALLPRRIQHGLAPCLPVQPRRHEPIPTRAVTT